MFKTEPEGVCAKHSRRRAGDPQPPVTVPQLARSISPLGGFRKGTVIVVGAQGEPTSSTTNR